MHNINEDFPRSLQTVSFSENAQSITVNIETKYKQLADLEKIIEMGFKEGFTAALENPDALFKG